MLNNKEFIKRLEKIMEFYDLTATALAEKIDFNRSSISHLISGRNNPSLEFVIKVLENFPEVNWSWLVHGKGSFPDKKSGLFNDVSSPGEKKSIPDLFSQNISESSPPAFSKEESSIERIVIFYKNGTFKNYESS